MTWRVDRARWVLTWGVSPFWGLPASLSVLLARIDTPHIPLGWGGGGWVAIAGWRAFRVDTRRYRR